MPIVEFRVDDRLLHGQVGLAWPKACNSQAILIANDVAAVNDIQKMALKMAAPAGQKVVVTTVDKAIELVNNPKSADVRLFTIVNCPVDAKRMVDGCGKEAIPEVNVGACGRFDGIDLSLKQKVNGNILVTEENKQALLQLQEMGVRLVHQIAPIRTREHLTIKEDLPPAVSAAASK